MDSGSIPISTALLAGNTAQNNRRPLWGTMVCVILVAIYSAWTAVDAMRSGEIKVRRTFLGFVSWDDINSDDDPIRFWFAVVMHWVAAAACVVGLVFLLKTSIS
jgi:hypothetical protein